jgi:hypothetical protein
MMHWIYEKQHCVTRAMTRCVRVLLKPRVQSMAIDGAIFQNNACRIESAVCPLGDPDRVSVIAVILD